MYFKDLMKKINKITVVNLHKDKMQYNNIWLHVFKMPYDLTYRVPLEKKDKLYIFPCIFILITLHC